MKSLYERLVEYGDSDYYGFHMPGHKRNKNIMGNELPYHIDITEIEGFDDLHHAKDILKVAQERAAKVYHADETCYLINGSTSGILSGVLGCTRKGVRILMARNCHKSVYAAVYMNELEPVYIYPEYDAENGLNGAIEAEKIREILETDRNDAEEEVLLRENRTERGAEEQFEADRKYSKIQAVVITSPTYDGVLSDIRAIAEVAHEFGIPLIVDEAHGAYFGMHEYFPENANQQGADVVIHSLHKTLPSLTQTALLHMNGNLVNRASVRKYVHMLQTSSPSYVLMASMDECIRFLEMEKNSAEQGIKEKGIFGRSKDTLTAGYEKKVGNIGEAQNGECRLAFAEYIKRLEKLRTELRNLKNMRLVETENYDKSKIVISTTGTVRRCEKKEIDIVRKMSEQSGKVLETDIDTDRKVEYTGKMLYEELLEKYHLQMEMASREYVLAMTSVCDTEEGFERLKKALFEIDEKLEFIQQREIADNRLTVAETGSGVTDGKDSGEYKKDHSMAAVISSMALPHLDMYCTSAKADILAEREEAVEFLSMKECVGKVSLEYAYVYPPGIPMIVPGERISEEAVHLLEKYESAGFDIEGLEKEGEMRVLLDMLPECGER